MNSSNPNHQKLHFVMFPLMAPGHMIPIIDMAKLIAKHDITVTIVTTPINAARFKPTVYRAIDAGLDLRVFELQFPRSVPGLPEGCENVDMLPSLSMAYTLVRAANKLQEPLENLLQILQPKPSCLISDMGLSWTNQVARKFNIPRIAFHGTCCFSLLCLHNIEASNILSTVNSDTESFVVPGLPDRIEVTKAMLPSSIRPNASDIYDARQEMRVAERESFGIVVNSFVDLEPVYFERYKEAKKKSVWCVGPVSLCSQDSFDHGNRGNKAAIDRDKCLEWLDQHKAKSVIYACLGSLCNLIASQIMELALGLEASNQPFVLALRGGHDLKEVEKLIEEEGLEQRTKGRGLVIKGWAPQVLLLSHPAVGGFLTHCGWNSTLEGLAAGLPMVTCPMFAEQFLNEAYVVHLMKIGVASRNPRNDQGNQHTEILDLNKEDVKRAVELVMSDGEDSKEMRKRAQRLGIEAKKAVQEGGCSDKGLRSMIQEVVQQINRGRETDHSTDT